MKSLLYALLIICLAALLTASCSLFGSPSDPEEEPDPGDPGGTAGISFSQTGNLIDGADYIGGNYSDIGIADLDGANGPDILITGMDDEGRVSKIFLNNGSGFFTVSPQVLAPLYYSDTALGDIDGDTDIDIVLMGHDTNLAPLTVVYTNNGSGVFAAFPAAGIVDLYRGEVELGDIDGDTDLDLIIMGYTSGMVPTSKTYTNNGAGVFAEINPGQLTGCARGEIKLVNIDGDGDLDLIMVGSDGGRLSKVYRNNGSGWFSEIHAGSLEPMMDSYTALGDIDGDTDIDLILIGGEDGGGRRSIVYKNNGSGLFIEANPDTLIDTFEGEVVLADFDVDGDLDLVYSGNIIGNTCWIGVYMNDGTGLFTQDTAHILIGVGEGALAAEDLDGDADADLVVTGREYSPDERHTRVYQNTH